jgi:hypothetical protein
MSGEWTGWDRRESGPGDAEQVALLLPGGMCTAVQYEELMAEPALAGVRMIAVTVPGMGGTPAAKDLSIENLARLRHSALLTWAATLWWGSAWARTSRWRWRRRARSAGRWCCWRPASRAG